VDRVYPATSRFLFFGAEVRRKTNKKVIIVLNRMVNLIVA